MLDEISIDDRYAEVLMLRTVESGLIVLVEGDFDRRVYSPHSTRSRSCFFPLQGRCAVLGVVELARDKQIGPPLPGIVDADYWHLDGIAPPGNVFVTDFHDLEILIAATPTVTDRLYDVMGSERKVQAFRLANPGATLLEALLSRIAPIGALRLISARREFDLSFHNFTANRLIDQNTLTVDVGRLVECVLGRSNEHPGSKPRIMGRIEEVLAQGIDLRQLCNGHDLLSIISVSLRKVLGSMNSKQIENERVGEWLALAFDRQSLRASRLFSAIVDWEGQNPDCSVFDQ